ncbi:gamma-butyrobetaine hydroxylase-like domain-containing protein [Terrihabitans sp. B22-R8]|uniref:gamma-butyrobetaine hydroxylase-like domain-containing protein n=1 Tax=Terrihabitans sp. B22-R8 TaxID=3425128 RepID=UPI00403C7F42
MTMEEAQPWPVEIRLIDDQRALRVTYDDGREDVVEAEYLRVESPSAEVQGHSPDQKVVVAGKKDVTISRIEPIGSYAVRLGFSDGHSTGIYTWSYLRGLVDRRDQIWTGYLNALAEKGLTR